MRSEEGAGENGPRVLQTVNKAHLHLLVTGYWLLVTDTVQTCGRGTFGVVVSTGPNNASRSCSSPLLLVLLLLLLLLLLNHLGTQLLTSSPTHTPSTATFDTHISAMPSPEAQLLADLLLAPAPLQDFTTLRQFTDIFPRGHRENPAVPQLYRELQRLRAHDMETVRRDIAAEVQRSKPLRREYARERCRLDSTAAPGLDPVALQIEDEVGNAPPT